MVNFVVGYSIKLSTNKVVSFTGLRLICGFTECDVEFLTKKYHLTDIESREVENHISSMFEFLN